MRGSEDLFLRNGLMQYGSIFGHGAYLGPDFTDDYLHRAALSVRDRYGGPRSDTVTQKTISDFQANRYDGATDSAAQAAAFRKLRSHYASFIRQRSSAGRPGIGGAAPRPQLLTSLDSAVVQAAYERDPQSASAEYGAELRTDIAALQCARPPERTG